MFQGKAWTAENDLSFSRVYLLLLLIALATGHAQAAISVVCDLSGNNSNVQTGDSCPNPEYLKAVERAVADVYPHLGDHLIAGTPWASHSGDDLRFIVDHSSMVVNHMADTLPFITQTFMGWSAEDDSWFYVYPSKDLYRYGYRPNGKIRVNFTEKFAQFKLLCEELIVDAVGRQKHTYQKACQSFFLAMITHELLHAHQYLTAPIPSMTDLIFSPSGEATDATGLPENENLVSSIGMVHKQAIRLAEKKLNYELDGFASARRSHSGNEQEILALAQRISDHRAENPEKYASGGRYSWLSADNRKDIVENYLRMGAAGLQVNGLVGVRNSLSRFYPTLLTGDLKYLMWDESFVSFMRGQFEPMKIVWVLFSINQGRVDNDFDGYDSIKKIEEGWELWLMGMSKDDLIGYLDLYPYLKDVVARYYIELRQFYMDHPDLQPFRNVNSVQKNWDKLAQETLELLEAGR